MKSSFPHIQKLGLILGLLLISLHSFAVSIKVACIGDSITEGSGTSNRSMYSYPSQLQNLLGPHYHVNNFGVSGRTLLKLGDRPYWNEAKYLESLSWQPDVVIIQLGTNDSKPQNWVYKNEFLNNYIELINNYKNLASQPEVYVAVPPAVYGSGAHGITNAVMVNEVSPLIRQAASLTGVQVIDNYSVTQNMPANFPDNVHPNNTGAFALSFNVYKSLGSPGNKVKFYEHSNFSGVAHSLPAGQYNGGKLLAAGIPNDWMSSLTVPVEMKVEIFEHGDFAGKKSTFTANVSYVGQEYNDIMSAFNIIPEGVTFFSESNFVGDSVTLAAGEYSGGHMLAAGIANDSVSSIKISEGFIVEVYQHGDFSGSKWIFSSDTADVGVAANNQMSAFKIISPGVSFFEHVDYGGASYSLRKGSYTYAQMTAAGIPNDWMSSLKVPNGLTVDVYEHGDFSGKIWTYSSDVSNVGSDANDKMSAILIY